MGFFLSKREKRYWIYSALVTLAILSTTLFLTRPFQRILVDQNVQFWVFLTGLILIASTIVYCGLYYNLSKFDLVVWLGMLGVAVMFFFRLGAAERSHIMEFSVLAIFLHLALVERSKHVKVIMHPSILSIMITVFIGVVDEGLQYFLPERVFDFYDIWFNVIAAVGAIGGVTALKWLKGIDKK